MNTFETSRALSCTLFHKHLFHKQSFDRQGERPLCQGNLARRYINFASILLLLIWYLLAGQNVSALAQPPSHAKLVVFLIADEFPYSYLARFQDKFCATGLRMLIEGGANFTHCRYLNASNQTASGQAVIATGAYPWATGIVADNWYDRKRMKLVSATASGENTTISPGSGLASARQLVGTTIGDEMKLAFNGHSKIFTIALNDRAALLLAGKFANNAFWWDSKAGRFTSSSPFGTEIASSSTNFADMQSGNTDGNSPRANQMVADFAKLLIVQEGLGQHIDPDFIGVNFSATESIGNHFGPNSFECEDMVLKLDEAIGSLLQFLDQKVGLSNCLIVFTADHGVAPIPEVLREKGADAGRIDPRSFRSQLNSALQSRLGSSNDWIEEFEPPNLYLNLNTIDRQERRQPDIEALAAKLAHSISGCGEVYSAFQLFLNQVPNGPLTEAVRKSYFWGRSGELFITPKPGYIFTTEATGTTSGSPYSYDAQVPLVLYGAGIKSGTVGKSSSPADIAPTVASLLGINAPPISEGDVLSEAIAQPYGPRLQSRGGAGR
jgi:predicted AlkP superfamily pyrophosphatase or phosphodiesterase